jgi:hypothetical protein
MTITVKKYFSVLGFAAVLSAFTACSTNDEPETQAPDPTLSSLLDNYNTYGPHATQAYVSTRSKGNKPNWDENENHRHPDLNDKDNKGPKEWPEKGEDEYMGTATSTTVKAHFFIRLDGDAITNNGLIDPSQYYPQTSKGSSYYGEFNEGYIQTDLKKTVLAQATPAITSWYYWNNDVRKYIYSSDGTATQAVIEQYPDITQWEINGTPIDTTEYHVIWYVVKLQSDGWHVDGILTTKDVTELPDDFMEDDGMEDIIDVPVPPKDEPTPDGGDDDNDDVVIEKGEGEVEFDIHQQQHETWNEIKTSVHLRDTVNVRVFLPVEGDFVAVADDFDIRTGLEYAYLTEKIEAEFTVGDKTFTTQIVVNHLANGIEILIEGSTCAEALKEARKLYDDGITFEVFSYIYPVNVSPEQNHETVWNWIKQAECVQTTFTGWPKSGDCCTRTYGQVTSAYFEDEVPHYKEP